MRRILIGSIPYTIFLVAILFLSIGFFKFVERESILAVFLTQRDAVIAADTWKGKDWSNFDEVNEDVQLPDANEKKLAVVRPGDRLLVPFFFIGDQIGTIHFPRIDHTVKAIQGDSEAQFRLGAGHSNGSYLPGQDGNIIFGAHRTNYFKKLEHVNVGDRIEFNAVYGNFIYQIDEIRIINGGDNSVAAETSKEQLTLYTCYPFVFIGNAPKRYIVISSLIESEIFS